MINSVTLAGNLTRDAEIRQTNGGSAILRFSIAVNERRKNGNTGEWEDFPSFFNCVIFGNRATALSQYLAKGTKVCVQGKLRSSSYEKNGEKRSSVDVIVDEVEFLSARSQSAQKPRQAPRAPQQYANPPQQQMAPQMAPQAPSGYVAAPGVYQPAMPQAPQPPQPEYYSEDIPFD